MLSNADKKSRPTAPAAAINAVARAAKIDRYAAALIVTRSIELSSATLRATMPDMPADDFAALVERYTNTTDFIFALAQAAAEAAAEVVSAANDNDDCPF